MLRDLLARRQLRSLYQPIVQRASGDLIGYEALARGPEGHALERPDLLFAAARELIVRCARSLMLNIVPAVARPGAEEGRRAA